MDYAHMDVRRQMGMDEIGRTAGGKHDAENKRKALGLDQPASTRLVNSNTLAGRVVRWLLIQATGVGSIPIHTASIRVGAMIKAKTDLLALNIGVQFEATIHPLDEG